MADQGKAVRKRTPLSTWVLEVSAIAVVIGVGPALIGSRGTLWLAVVGLVGVLVGLVMRRHEQQDV